MFFVVQTHLYTKLVCVTNLFVNIKSTNQTDNYETKRNQTEPTTANQKNAASPRQDITSLLNIAL